MVMAGEVEVEAEPEIEGGLGVVLLVRCWLNHGGSSSDVGLWWTWFTMDSRVPLACGLSQVYLVGGWGLFGKRWGPKLCIAR